MNRRRVAIPAFYPFALVVFSGNTDIRWLRILRPGFRHVFVALCDGTHWITVDPLSHRTEVAVQPVGADFDLADHYRRNGLRVVEVTPPAVRPRPAPVAICTCVEATKRVLGIHHPFLFTPWQLHRYLERHLSWCPDPAPRDRSHISMIRIYSLFCDIARTISRAIVDIWRSLRRGAARIWARLTTAAKALFE